MTLRRTTVVVLIIVANLAGCARARRPDGPYRAAEELTDALSDEAVDCAKKHAPQGSGEILVAAEFSAEGQPPKIHDAGSSPGSEAVIACVRERATAELRSPAARPAPYARVKVPLPLVTANVKYAFVQQLDNAPPAPAAP